MRSHTIALRYSYPQVIAEEMEGQIAYLGLSCLLLDLGSDPAQVFPGLLTARAGTSKEPLSKKRV